MQPKTAVAKCEISDGDKASASSNYRAPDKGGFEINSTISTPPRLTLGLDFVMTLIKSAPTWGFIMLYFLILKLLQTVIFEQSYEINETVI